MTMGTFTLANQIKELIGDGTVDLDNDTFKAALVTSAGAVDITDDNWADISANEASNYSQVTLTTVTWTRSGANVTFDCDAIVFTATGGDITARWLVIFDDTPTSPADPIVGFALLDDTPADKVISEDDTYTITPPAGGVFVAS